YGEDEFFKKVMADLEAYADFREDGGLLFKRAGEGRVLCIPNVKVGERNIREIIIGHSHSLLAHLGHKKTLHLLREEVWW
ncbi:hypothetical protein M378DRAFT_36433, partial [Amanita muscaria Koide BX008]